MTVKNLSVLAAAVAAIGAFGASYHAEAVTLNQLLGGYKGKIQLTYNNYDMGTLYAGYAPGTYDLTNSANAAMDALSAPGAKVNPGNPSGNEDSWAIFRVTSIQDEFGMPLWTQGLLTGKDEITGIFYGTRDTYVEIKPLVGQTQLITKGVGGNFQFYYDDGADPTKLFFSGGLPLYTSRTAADVMPKVTNGQLILSGKTVAGIDGPASPVEFRSNVVIDNGTGRIVSGAGDFWGDWTTTDTGKTGDFNSAFGVDPDEPLPAHEVNVHFTVTQAAQTPAPPWSAFSNDPLRAFVIPTPAAVYGGLLLAAVVGVNAMRQRRARRD